MGYNPFIVTNFGGLRFCFEGLNRLLEPRGVGLNDPGWNQLERRRVPFDSLVTAQLQLEWQWIITQVPLTSRDHEAFTRLRQHVVHNRHREEKAELKRLHRLSLEPHGKVVVLSSPYWGKINLSQLGKREQYQGQSGQVRYLRDQSIVTGRFLDANYYYDRLTDEERQDLGWGYLYVPWRLAWDLLYKVDWDLFVGRVGLGRSANCFFNGDDSYTFQVVKSLLAPDRFIKLRWFRNVEQLSVEIVVSQLHNFPDASIEEQYDELIGELMVSGKRAITRELARHLVRWALVEQELVGISHVRERALSLLFRFTEERAVTRRPPEACLANERDVVDRVATDSPETQVIAEDMRQRLLTALDELEAEERAAIELTVLEELPLTDCAGLLEMSVDRCASLVASAKEKLRRLLDRP